MSVVARRRCRALFATAIALALAVPAHAAPPAPNDARVARALAFITSHPSVTMHGVGQAFEARDLIAEADGRIHVRFDRRLNGMRVIGGDLIVHSDKAGSFNAANLTLKRPLAVAPRPTVSEAQATAIGATHGVALRRPELVVYARSVEARLAWDVNVASTASDGTPQELHVIIDALTAQELDRWDDIHTGTAVPSQPNGKTYFSGTVSLTTTSSDTTPTSYSLNDPTRGGQYTINMQGRQSGGSIYTTSTNVWGDNTLANTATLGADAQYGAAMTWDYYATVLGRSGIDDAKPTGTGAMSRVHYGKRYNNAFWSDGCYCMTYGDGDGTTYNPFVALDVAGHEMSHGLTSRTAKLIYSGESGGLNEGTSDIFGNMVEYSATGNSTNVWLVGEQLYRSGGGKALRYMKQPSRDGRSADCWYSGVGSLDVHLSSGVANYFFYFLSEGAKAGDAICRSTDTRVAGGSASSSNGTTFSGIGKDAAAKLWYKALTTQMTSSTNYSGARAATLAAAGTDAATIAAVTNAWNAVNVKQ